MSLEINVQYVSVQISVEYLVHEIFLGKLHHKQVILNNIVLNKIFSLPRSEKHCCSLS